MLRLLIVLAATAGAVAQIDTPVIPPEKDVRDLYQRIASADMVAVVTELRSKVAFRRVPATDAGALEKSMSEGPRGQLFVAGVERVLCRKADFSSASAEPPKSLDDVVYIFVPQDEPYMSGPYHKEYLLPNRRYLLLLQRVPPGKVDLWTRTLEVDPDHVYYRVAEAERGVIPLRTPTAENPTPEQPPILAELSTLCQAVKPTKPALKVERLKKLLDSADPVIRTEADKAIRAIEQRPQ